MRFDAEEHAAVLRQATNVCFECGVPLLPHQAELCTQCLIEEGGGLYRGRMSEGGMDVVLFDSPTTRTTLCLPIEKITSADVIRQHITASNAKFEKAKAAHV